MGFIFFTIVKQMYQRCLIYRRLNRLERIKIDGIRRKHRLPPIYTLCDCIWDIICFPFVSIFHCLYDFYERMITSIGSRGRKPRLKGHFKRIFINYTEENALFRKVLYFLFGLCLTYLAFLFIYYQHFLNNYSLIGLTIAMTVVFALIAPFNEGVVCLILIGLPSLFSSNVRYILVAYIMYTIYFQVVPNIWNNSMEGIESFGCSVYQTGKGGKRMARLMVEDIKQFIRGMKFIVKKMIDDLKQYMKIFDLGIKLPHMNLKALCNEPTDKDVYNCEDKMTMGSIGENRIYPPGICTMMWSGFAQFCQEMKRTMIEAYKGLKEELMEEIRKIERELYFDVELNHDFDYHYNTSDTFDAVFKRVGVKFIEKHWLLPYLSYILNIRSLLLLILTCWIIFISFVYRLRYVKSDPFDNTYIDEEILKIDKKRTESGKETIIPLDINERKFFIYPFDIMMTSIEANRFLFGMSIMSFTVSHIFVYLVFDIAVYNLIYWYNTFIDILSNIFAPASITVQYTGDSLFASRLNRLNKGFDVKKKIVERLQECKSSPLAPDKDLYKQIFFLLGLILLTVFSSSYGLRLRHYFAGLFYPHRKPIRAVWLYNNILCRRGNIFQFFRKEMRKKVFGERSESQEDVSIVDRLCAQYSVIRIVCTLLGFYGKHKYCQTCGRKVKIDGTDQSVRCVQNCGSIYCFDCFGDRNNICSNCMNPIDYSEMGDISEEMDSSDEDIDYNLVNEDYLYQYSEEAPPNESAVESEEEILFTNQRKDLVSLAYKYDVVERVPTHIYIVDDDEYDAEDESDDIKRSWIELEQELGIPAEHIQQMKQNAKLLVVEDMRGVSDRVKEEKYNQLKREDDQRLVKNSLVMVNKDRKRNLKKSRHKLI